MFSIALRLIALKIHRLIWISGAMCCLGFAVIGTAEALETRQVRVGVYSNEPKIFTDATGKPSGVLIEVLESIAAKEGWKLEFVACDWQDCLDALKTGKIDLMPDVAYSPQRDQMFDFHKQPSLYSWSQLYARADAPISSTFDLNGKRVAVLEGSIQEEFFGGMMLNFGLKVQLVPAKTLNDVFALVTSGKADAAIANNFFGDYHASRYKLAETPIVFQPSRLFYVTANGRNPDLLELIDRQLSAWTQEPDSEYFQILQKWRGASPIALISPRVWQVLGTLSGLVVLLIIAAAVLRWQVKVKVRHLVAAQANVLERTAELARERDAAQRYLDIADVMLMALDRNGKISMINKKGAQLLEQPENVLIGMDWFASFIPLEERNAVRQFFNKMMAGEKEISAHYENRIVSAIGQQRIMAWNNTLLRDEDGSVAGTLSSAEDITERKQAEADLRIAATAFEAQEGIVITDCDGTILRINQAYTKITGYNDEDAIGKKINFLKSDRHAPEFYDDIWQAIIRDGFWHGEIWNRNKNGEVHPHRISVSAVKGMDGAVTHYVGTYMDSTELRQSEDKINELAFFDQLTGLPNRVLLMDRLRQLMTATVRSERYGALLFIDLDNFKTLNDTLGHDMGDLLLQQVAQRLTTCIREGDTVARLGGDEFMVMLANLSSLERDAAAQTEVVGGKILAGLNLPYQLDKVAYRITPSVGATLFCGHRTEVDVLLKQADLAMYKSKDAGRNALRFFDPGMEVVVMKRAALEKDLHEALQEKQFLLYYQAQIAGGQLTGAEVLIRWQHPRRGIVSPAEFIPLAEETGLILPLGRWVLESACTQLAVWAADPRMDHLTVAVNVSAHQFSQADFVEQVLAVLKSTGANPYLLKLELTESLLVSNIEDVVEKMFALKAKGVGFSLDDFGTGYSSLSYLKRLPLDQLKIDQSFVRDVLSDPNDAAIAKTIIALAQSLGLGVIAEGVETAEQRNFLNSAGCHAFQGYFFSRPLPIEGFEKFAQQV
ncbi:MAG: EAL domain-containing protein [Undibacterium sp.]|nr:EAL domain-containing protein [Undibacterium sp.]